MFVCWSDVDECSTQRGMCRNGQCLNSLGSFLCVCNDGYELTQDGRLCTGKEPPFFILNLNEISILYSVTLVYSLFSQISMNVQWIQAHAVLELVWIWMALTGVSAHWATISMRRPVKVQQPEVLSASRSTNISLDIKNPTSIFHVIKYLHLWLNLTSGYSITPVYMHKLCWGEQE